jgi:ribosomal protein S18 acetylase RimI-like enzyme
LASHGFEIEPYLYLSRSLARTRDTGIEAHGEAWRSEDLPAAADLLASAYTANAARHFAPDGCWERYVTSLISQAGCGTFDPALTRVVRDGVRLAALIVITSVAPATAHIAQIAVRPDRRGAGLARALVAGAAEQAGAAGNTTLTLLVGDENATARRLYESMGFAPRATFVATTGTKWRTARYVA